MRSGAIASWVASWVSMAGLGVMIQAFPVARAAGASEAAGPPAAIGPHADAPAPVAPAAPVATAAPPPPAAVAPMVPAAAPAAAPPRRRVALLSHDLQLGLAVLFGDGYRGIVPYTSMPMIYCADARARDARVCTNRSPPFVDLQPSFGLSETWDFLVDVRFGLTVDFNQYHQLFVMPGFRHWLDPRSRVKFFTTLQLSYDRSKQNSPLVGDADLGVRNSNGLMFEVMRNLGVYLQFGETVGFVRWLSFLVDGGIGVQARVP